MKILITGAGGFIGSHLAERIAAEGHAVRAFSHYGSKGTAGWLDTLPIRDAIDIVPGDIRDYDAVLAAMRGCDRVFHLAALIGIPYSYVSPLAYLRTNIEGTYNILEAARQCGTGSIVVTSTSETYGSAQAVPMDEQHPCRAQSPYAATKIAADQLALSYHRSFGTPVVIARPFNTYGPRQSARAVIPAIIAQIASGQRRIELGNLHPTRDFNFVADTVSGFLAAAQAPELIGSAVNIGSGVETSIGDLARRIAQLMGAELTIAESETRTRHAASEVSRLICDASKLRESTGWQPQFSLDDGLRATIDWFNAHPPPAVDSAYRI